MRRFALALVLWLGCALLAYGQQPQVPVVGWLNPSTRQTVPIQLLCDSIAKHGFVDGRNVRLDIRLAEGNVDRLSANLGAVPDRATSSWKPVQAARACRTASAI